MDIFLWIESGIVMTAARLRIRIYKSNDLYEAANPCTFLVGSPVLELKYSYCVQIFYFLDATRPARPQPPAPVRWFRDIG